MKTALTRDRVGGTPFPKSVLSDFNSLRRHSRSIPDPLTYLQINRRMIWGNANVNALA